MSIFWKSTLGVASLAILSPCLRAQTLSGRVVGPDGKPVAATVYFIRNGAWNASPKQVQTAADGTFRFEAELPKSPKVAGTTASTAPQKASGALAAYAPGFSLGTAFVSTFADNTVRLSAPRKISGVLRDDKGALVVGAPLHVSLFFQTNGSGSRQNQQYLFFDPPASLLPRFSTKTDAKGAWEIVGAPPLATVDVELDDEKYVQDSAQFNADGQPGGPGERGLVARRAGVVGGRVLDAMGAPVAGIQVVANPFPGQAGARRMGGGTTRSDGTFRINRVYPGTYTLLARDMSMIMAMAGVPGGKTPVKQRRVVAPALQNVRVEAGQTVQNNTLRLVTPAIVKGRVLDRSGKPMSEVSVGAYGKSAPRSAGTLPSTFTDKEGRFELALVPGANAIYAFESDRFNSDAPKNLAPVPVTLRAGANEAVSLRVERRFADAQGEVVEENGAPVANVDITVWNTRGTGQTLRSDDKGHFELKRMDIGSLRLAPTEEWTVVSPKKFVLPSVEPVKIVLRHNQMARVSVRVVDAAGKPIEGVKMRFTVPVQGPEGQDAHSILSLTSDAAGQVAFEPLKMPEALQLKLEAVSKKGFKWRGGGGEVVGAKAGDDAFVLSDVVMDSLGGKLKGVVNDREGRAIEGVLVRSSGDSFQNLAVTDAAGRFELADQPAGEVELLAAQGRNFSRVKTSGDQTQAQITLQPGAGVPPQDVDRAVALFREMAPSADSRTVDEAAVALAPLRPATALELLSLPKIQPDNARSRVIEILPATCSDEALAWAQGELPKIKGDADFVRAGARLGMLLCTRQPEAAKTVFDAIDARRAALKGQEATVGTAWVAALAARLKLPGAQLLFDQALAPALRDPGQLSSIVEPLSSGTTTLAEAILDELPPGQESNIYRFRQAIHEVARFDAAGAARLLEQMRVLVDAAPQLPTENGHLRGRDALEFDWAFAAKDVLRALPRSEAATATHIAERVQGWHRVSALALAAEFGTREQRLAMVSEAADAENRGSWMKTLTLPRLGALAAEFDQERATDLFTQTAQTVEEERRDRSDVYSTDWSFYASFWNPAQARLALEADWARLRQSALQSTQDPHNMVGWNEASLSMAMSAVDLDRALEWARGISDKPIPYNPSPRARALEFMGELLLQEPTKRRLLVISPESGFDS